MDSSAIDWRLEQARTLCKRRGVRLTEQRERVLAILCTAGKPMGAYEILETMHADGVGSFAPPTVYRALEFLLEQGLIHRLESQHAFVGCCHPDHPHASQFLICAECGGVTELENPQIAEMLASAARASGFAPQKPVVEMIGTCSACAQHPPPQGESLATDVPLTTSTRKE